MRDKIQQIREKALAEIDKADGLEKLNDVRAAILGKKGIQCQSLNTAHGIGDYLIVRLASAFFLKYPSRNHGYPGIMYYLRLTCCVIRSKY